MRWTHIMATDEASVAVQNDVTRRIPIDRVAKRATAGQRKRVVTEFKAHLISVTASPRRTMIAGKASSPRSAILLSMAHQMNADERAHFLGESTRTGKLATTRANGSPHVAPVWFIVDGDDLVFMTGADTVKGRAMLRDPRVALAVDDENPPFSFVLVEGEVTISRDLDEMLPWSIAIARRYMGEELAERYGRRNAVEGELLVRLRPVRITAVAGLAD